MDEAKGPLERLSEYVAHSEVARRLGSVRRYLLAAVALLVVGSGAGFGATSWVLADIQAKQGRLAQVVMLSPAEGFMVRIKLSIAMGAVLAIPAVMLGVWSAVTRQWPRRRRFLSFLVIPAALGLFSLGAYFAYGWIVPAALRFLLSFSSDQLEAFISVNSLVSFVLTIVVPFALLFQLPLLVMFLARAGVINHRLLAERRGYAIVGIAALAAALTPSTDVFSQLLMAGPLVVVYEVSIWVAWLAEPRSARRRPAVAAPEV